MIGTIDPREVTFHPISGGDSSGRLFWWKGDLYRGISPAAAPMFRQLLADGLLEELSAARLTVPTELVDMQISDFDLVLRHDVIEFPTYPFEWCIEMLRDAALSLLRLESVLVERGLTLKDGHSWNVMFDGPHPLFVDIGSIAHASSDVAWPAYAEFRRFFMNPLSLVEMGELRLARWLLHDAQEGVTEDDIRMVRSSLRVRRIRRHVSEQVGRLKRAARRIGGGFGSTQSAAASFSRSARLSFLRDAREEITSLRLGLPTSPWHSYYEGFDWTFRDFDSWDDKQRSMLQVLEDIRPRTVVDVGCSWGWYAALAADRGSKVVAIDIDEDVLNGLYLFAKNRGLDLIPVVHDFRNVPFGMEVVGSPAQRLRGEAVFALALVHHLALRQGRSFERIVGDLRQLTDRWLIVEFIPKEDEHVAAWEQAHLHPWYRLDNFEAILATQFRRIERLSSYPTVRTLLLCEV